MLDNLNMIGALEAPPQYDHEITVRAVGPAIVLVLELEAPIRSDVLASTEQEFQALLAWVSSNPAAAHVYGAYREAKSFEEGSEDPYLWRREDAHAARLERGSVIATDRIAS